MSGQRVGEKFVWGRLRVSCLVGWTGDLDGDWEVGLEMSEDYKVFLG